MVDGLGPAGVVAVTPGTGVTAPGVSVSGKAVWVAMDNIGVAVAGAG